MKLKKMAKVKKSLSLFTVFFLILSNITFAQLASSSAFGSEDEETARQAKSVSSEKHFEGIVATAPATPPVTHQLPTERELMERFMRGELSEDEMRAMAKAKSGSAFSEMEFQKGMIELKERMSRKEAFSYENKGYGQRYPVYYAVPSYEGYDKEHMIFGMLFEHIGDYLDARDIKNNCNEPDKIAGNVLGKLREKVGDLQKICSRMEEEEARCDEMAKKGCLQIGSPVVRQDATEIEKISSIAYSCPVNKDAIIEACRKRNIYHIEQRISNADEECKKRFDFEGERLLKACERFRQSNICDKDRFMEHCTGGIKKEDFEERGKKGFRYASWQCYDGLSESHSDDACKPSEAWQELARKSCEGHCYADKSKCGVNSFSVSGECGSFAQKPVPSPCPSSPVPSCSNGATLKTKTDSNGCIYYYCEAPITPTPVVCAADVQQCPDGSYVKRMPPQCNFEACPSVQCPAVQMPSCEPPQTLQKKLDNKGCTYYNCESAQLTTACPYIQKPSCNAGETLQAYYDNAGCVTSYQCLRQEISCPAVTKPACAEGQSLTTRYDDNKCIIGYECISITESTSSSKNTSSSITGYAIRVTGNAALNVYDNFLRQCENSWLEQQRICLNMPHACDKETYVENCKEQERRNYADLKSNILVRCEKDTIAEVMSAEQRCSRINEERQRCLEESAKRCEQMKGNAQQCRELLTEEKVRNFILDEIKKRCRFIDIVQDKEEIRKAGNAEIVLAVLNTATEDDITKLRLFVDNLKEDLKLKDTTVYKGTIEPNRFGDIKLLPFVINAKLSPAVSSERAKEVKAAIVAGQKFEEAATKLVSLRDSDVPSEYLYIIEDKASEVLDVSDKLKEVEEKEEQKGLGYKVRLFLGLAKRAEQEEIRQLGESKEKLKSSIEALEKLIGEVPSDVAKAILKEQVESLRTQHEDIEVLIETKEKKSKGLLGLFG